MTTMAPYRENRFQGFARRFSEFYHAKSCRPFIVIGCLYVIYLLVSTTLRSVGFTQAAFYALVVYFVALIGLLALSFYGMRQKWRKRDYEFDQRMAAIHDEFDDLLRSYQTPSYGVPDGHLGHDVIEGEVMEDNPSRRALDS